MAKGDSHTKRKKHLGVILFIILMITSALWIFYSLMNVFNTDTEPLPNAGADIINKTMPEVKVLYSGPRQGKMIMSWGFKNKTINFVYSGEFLTDKAMWKMGISRHTYKISKERVNPFQKHIKVEVSDFDDLRRKSKAIGNKR